MRAHIGAIPDGSYAASAFMDSDGVVDAPLEIALDATVTGSDITLDFSRSSAPCAGPMNSVWASTLSAVYVGLKHIFPDLPMNAGCFTPVHVAGTEDTFLQAKEPRPVAGCASETSPAHRRGGVPDAGDRDCRTRPSRPAQGRAATSPSAGSIRPPVRATSCTPSPAAVTAAGGAVTG